MLSINEEKQFIERINDEQQSHKKSLSNLFDVFTNVFFGGLLLY